MSYRINAHDVAFLIPLKMQRNYILHLTTSDNSQFYQPQNNRETEDDMQQHAMLASQKVQPENISAHTTWRLFTVNSPSVWA